MTIKALIVDDEQLARDELQYLLGSIDDVEVVAQGKNGIEAIALVPRLAPDVVFLDVQMPGLDGFAVLRKLLEKTGPETLPQIIFATAFDKYAVRAFEVNAVDYLLKPFDRGRLEQALERVRARLQSPAPNAVQSAVQNETQTGHDAAPSPARSSTLSSQQLDSLIRLLEQQSSAAPANGRSSKIVVQAGTRMLLVDQKELCFAAIDEGVISVSTPTIEGQSKCRTLEELLELLDPQIFWRAHRSYVVNINHIKEVVPWFKSSYQLRMNDRKNTEIPVSRAQTRRLRELFKL
jgi:two-component system LytT family response regulator/two-component system response regulator LytT